MNRKVYIHEEVSIRGSGRARYMHHVTAWWSPIGRAERGQLCFGVFGTVGSTGRWPEVINLWEEDGFAGLARSFEHELSHPGLQDPSLRAWWRQAEPLRRGGFDRILLPAAYSPTVADLLARGVRGAVYTQEIVSVEPGAGEGLLEDFREHALPALEGLGAALVGAFRNALVRDSECVLLCALPSFAAWGELEEGRRRPGALRDRLERGYRRARDFRRTLLVEAPLSPLRLGRQPEAADRRSLDEIDPLGS